MSQEEPTPEPSRLGKAIESGYLPALLTALATTIPAALYPEGGATGELRNGLLLYALPMSLVGSKAFSVTFTPLSEWWARALSSSSFPVAPMLLMAGFLQAWTLMAACVTQLMLQKTMGLMLSGGIFGPSSTTGGIFGELQNDLVIWFTTPPILISLALTVVVLLLFRGLVRKPGEL